MNRSGLDLVEHLHGFPTLIGEVADEVLEVLRVELLHQRRATRGEEAHLARVTVSVRDRARVRVSARARAREG